MSEDPFHECEAYARSTIAANVPGPGNKHETTIAAEMYVQACCTGALRLLLILCSSTQIQTSTATDAATQSEIQTTVQRLLLARSLLTSSANVICFGYVP